MRINMNIETNFTTFSNLAITNLPIVLSSVIQADHLTPMRVYENLSHSFHHGFLAEMNESHPDKIFMCFEPRGTFKYNQQGYSAVLDGNACYFKSSPIDALREFQHLSRVQADSASIGLSGTLLGFINYDSMRLFEEKLRPAPSQQHHPEFSFHTYKINLVFDTKTQLLTLCVVQTLSENLQGDYQKAIQLLTELAEKINAPFIQNKKKTPRLTDQPIQPSISDHDYQALVKTAKTYIQQGDIFQVVLSRSFKKSYDSTPFEIYRTVRRIAPVPYLFFMDTGDESIIGASPEKLVSVHNKKVETVPIAGTCKNTGEDAVAALLNDEKECAEHTMLVDLSRNDLGKVCKAGSVQLEYFLKPKTAGNLVHLTTLVTGELDNHYDALDAFIAVFPAGTLSGAPKIRAMEIIDELEKEPRELYGGALCFIDNAGNLDSAIVIRTMRLKDGIATLRAGAGIVFDSIPEKEAQESFAKASSILKAIQITEEANL
jgi:anthranilate synthase component 1